MKKLLFNPFEDHSEKRLFLYGLFFTITGSFLGLVFNGRFDGMIDLHFVKSVRHEPFTDNLIAVLSSTTVLFILAKLLNKRSRLIDILTACMIARAPLYLLAFFNINGFMNAITSRLLKSATPADIDAIPATDLMYMLLFSMIGIVFLIWFFVLLWNGFRVASNARGARHILFFVTALIIGEALSKLLIIVSR